MATPRPHRPVVTADIEKAVGNAFSSEDNRLELAHRTAEAVLEAGRCKEPREIVNLADTVGLETLAELWRGAEPSSLPGTLWMLYALRTWCVRDGDQVARLYRAGRALAPVDEVVAGAPDAAGPSEVRAVADEVLCGLHRGDFAVALERAASFFRIVAMGREQLAAEGVAGRHERDQAERNRECSKALALAADSWRAGTLG